MKVPLSSRGAKQDKLKESKSAFSFRSAVVHFNIPPTLHSPTHPHPPHLCEGRACHSGAPRHLLYAADQVVYLKVDLTGLISFGNVANILL